MKRIARTLAALSLVLGVHAVHAGGGTAAALTRAEVQADLHLYRDTGLYLLDAGEVSPQSESYKAASQRYAALRSSPRYSQLVRKYEDHEARGAERTAQLAQ